MDHQIGHSERHRKFILTFHIYPGADIDGEIKDQWMRNYTHSYFNMTHKYHHKIILEVAGHDHYADIRYHHSLDKKSYNLHNVVINAGITPTEFFHPGFTVFDIDATTMIP